MRSKTELFEEIKRLRDDEERRAWIEELSPEEIECVLALARLANVAAEQLMTVMRELIVVIVNGFIEWWDGLPDEWKGEDKEHNELA